MGNFYCILKMYLQENITILYFENLLFKKKVCCFFYQIKVSSLYFLRFAILVSKNLCITEKKSNIFEKMRFYNSRNSNFVIKFRRNFNIDLYFVATSDKY